MKRVLIHINAKKLQNGQISAKTYSLQWWQAVIGACPDCAFIQLGIQGDMILNGVVPLLNQSEEQILEVCAASNHIVAVDSFLPHLLAPSKRQIIVLWSKSDPNLFGYPWNINLLKDRKYLRPDQMGIWDTCDYDNDAFIDPEVLIKILNTPQIIVP